MRMEIRMLRCPEWRGRARIVAGSGLVELRLLRGGTDHELGLLRGNHPERL